MTLLHDIVLHCTGMGDKIAVIGPRATRSFAQMSCAIATLAQKMAAVGASGQPVAICCTDPALQIAAICAAMIAGRPFLSLDQALSPAAWADLSTQHDIAHLCSDRAELTPLIAVGEDAFLVRLNLSVAPLPDAQPTGLCGFLMTSGASARPKLVALTFAQLDAKAKSKDSCLHLQPDHVLAMTAALSSSAGLSSALKALRSGAQLLVLRPADEGLDRLCDAITRHRATTLFCSPTLLRALMIKTARIPPALCLVRVGGETLYSADVERFRHWAPGARLVNHYGQSETISIAQGDVAEMKWQGECVPVGRPNGLVQLRFLDEAGRDVPDCEAGFIEVTSPLLALGYRGDRRISDAVFTDAPAGRRFWTGDLGRLNADGCLEVLGRAGRAVKMSGLLVHLDAVEDLIRALPGVVQVAVLDRRSANRQAVVLVAFVVAAVGYDRSMVRAAILGLTPAHQIPRVITFLDELPETSSGKVDRELLRQRL